MLFFNKKPKRYLITGGCGFIGSHLADTLVAQGHEVVILDDLSNGNRENAPMQATFIVGDAGDYATVERAFERIDGCFHLAAVASVQRSLEDWAGTHRANLTAAINVFQAASRSAHKVPVVYASSAAVYGDSAAIPIAEESPTLPLTAYGADKLGCELHARVAWIAHGVPTIGLRPFNVYGPRQDAASPYSGVISIFAGRMTQGQPVTIYGDGEQLRDFVYVDDAIAAFLTAMQYVSRHRQGHPVINVCTGRSTSINQLAGIVAQAYGREPQRQNAPARTGDIRVSVGDPARLKTQLGLTLDITLEEGLRKLATG